MWRMTNERTRRRDTFCGELSKVICGRCALKELLEDEIKNVVVDGVTAFRAADIIKGTVDSVRDMCSDMEVHGEPVVKTSTEDERLIGTVDELTGIAVEDLELNLLHRAPEAVSLHSKQAAHGLFVEKLGSCVRAQVEGTCEAYQS